KFNFSFLIQGVGKRDVWKANQLVFSNMGIYDGLFQHQLDYWMPDNEAAFYPRNYAAASGNSAYSRLPQTKYLLNGAYLMLKSVEIGYDFEPFKGRKFNNSIRVFVTGENLYRLADLPPGIDPELADIGVGGIYPQLRKLSVGLNVTF